MYHKKNNWNMGQRLLLLSGLCILLAAIGVTYAFLSTKTQNVTNQFDPVTVTCAVEEQFDGNVKQNVCIRNTGDINAFIRAAVVINWVGEDGKILAATPQAGTEYTVSWGDSGWVQGSDGFWYYRNAVAAGEATPALIRQIVPVNAPAGFSLQVQILATAIQADPPKAVENAWGVSVNGASISPI